MNESTNKFWPFGARASMISVLVLLAALLIAVAVLRSTIQWPSEKSENHVLLGILLISLLPVLLALLDVFSDRGGVIEYKGVKIAFAQAQSTGFSEITVPVNIGARGEPLNASGKAPILDALKQATTGGTVIIDLEEGQAWWETRLLVLLAGADRLKKPDKLVFIGTVAGREQCYLGWAYSGDLFRHLVRDHPQYLRSLEATRAAARQWQLVEPINPQNPTNPGEKPAQPPWMQGALATGYAWWWAFNDLDGLPNELLAEQLLATDLGEKIERPLQGSRTISATRLDDLFSSVLIKEHIEQNLSTDQQIEEFFDGDAPYLAITQNGRYSRLVARLTVLNLVVRTLAVRK
jgi:hypothetical protein